MNTIEKVGVVIVAAALIAALVDPELCVPGLVFIVIVCFLWERTRE